ncbi:MAG: hypothetical protein GY710_11235 [Desulfobacteraceae bacterium]|nr:hypothetical protein [Desulfobacteraceae bacterium]
MLIGLKIKTIFQLKWSIRNMRMALIVLSVSVLFTGCSTAILMQSTEGKSVKTELVGIYSDKHKLYVRYKADLSAFSEYEKIGEISKDSLWRCAEVPSKKTKIPHLVNRGNDTYRIYLFNPEKSFCNGRTCKVYNSISKIKDIELSLLKSIPINPVASVDKDDPIFNDKTRSFFAFSVEDKNDYPSNHISMLLVDRVSKKVLVMKGLKNPEDSIYYQSLSGSITRIVGIVPATICDVVTSPIQFAVFILFLINLK